MSRIAVVSLVGGLAAACSDSARLSDDPFSNPFNGQSRDAQAAPSSQPYQSQGYAPAAQPGGYAAAPTPGYAPQQPYQPVANVSGGGWTASGGTTITVSQGDSLTTISNRYGVPTNAILSANGLSSASQVAPGRDIVIPVYSATAVPTKVASVPGKVAPVPFKVATAPAMPQPPARLASNTLQRTNQRAVEIARAPANSLNNAKQVADAKVATAQAAAQKKVAQPVVAAKAHAEQAPQKVVAAAQAPVDSAKFSAPARDAEQTASLAAPSQSNTDFRWPAKGRVISGFNAGGGNEGINIAVPEGTPVRATESGVVTFAGDDVKSYGNLVLIKHDNGYISAYAHNGALNVKRGERVTRGQVIAKSGQTGDVTSPQLHFEIRKGQTPVDPVPYLGG